MKTMMQEVPFRACALAAALGVMGCGSSGSASPDGGTKPTGPILPWKTGNTWTYRVTDPNSVTTKVMTVGESEAIGGTGPNADQMALKVTTKTKDGTDQTLTWAAEVADAVVRYREQSYDAGTGLPKADDYYDPDKLWADGSAEHTTNGASWLEVYTDTKIPVGGATGTGSENRDLWTVTSDNESVTVPAGTFDAVVFQKAGSTNKTYWYVRGVGKVKETGGQVEELVSFMLTP